MCRETLPEVPNIPNWQPVDNEELRFAKRQQWYVAASVGAVNAAAYSQLKGTQLRGFETCVVTIFILLVVAAGVVVMATLQSHIRTLRQRSEPNPPWHRWSDVFWLLTIFVVAIAVGVLYFLERPSQSGSRSEFFAVVIAAE